MDQYILNLIPRIIQAGKKLNQIEAIVDKVWVKYGEEDYETYRFKRNNLALVSLAGIVEERKWEILPPNGLYINKDGSGIMYRQAVLLNALLIMQIESKKYTPVLFYDEAIIADGNVISYLKAIFSQDEQKSNTVNNANKAGSIPKTTEIYRDLMYETVYGSLIINKYLYNPSLIDNDAYLNNIVAPDRKYEIIGHSVYKWIKVKNGKVSDFQQK